MKYAIDVRNAGDCCLNERKPFGSTTGLKSALILKAPRKKFEKGGFFKQTSDYTLVLGGIGHMISALRCWNAGLSFGTRGIPGSNQLHSANVALTLTAPRKSAKKVKTGPFWVVFCCYLDNGTTLRVSKNITMCALTMCI